MNKRNHIDLKPHIDSLCAYFGTTKEELTSKPHSNKPDAIKRLIFAYLYYKVGATYQNIANEFGVKIPSISQMMQKANEALIDQCPLHLEVDEKLKRYVSSNIRH
jgi:hypothetical protein